MNLSKFNLTLPKIFGIATTLHWSFWLGLIYFSLLNGSVGFMLIAFSCVLAHEYGHSLMAKRLGFNVF